MVSERVVRITAPNPSPMTLDGTNTYIVLGASGALVIDPGPIDRPHQDAVLEAIASHNVPLQAILVTHGHPDHAPGAGPLHRRTGAPVYGHANARFPHDVTLCDGDAIEVGGVSLRALDAPGHADDHLVYAFADRTILFTGDVVVGRGTVVVAPPRGDMRAYIATLRRLRADYPDVRVIYGGHGDAINEPRAKLDEYIAHRLAREQQLVAALERGECTIPELVTTLYADVSRVLWPAAARQILAYLIALEREGAVRSRTLERPLAPEERAILNPDLSALTDPQSAAVAAAELGYDKDVDRIEAYRRSS